MNDEQLCELANKGDEQAERRLILNYSWLVKACSRPLFLAGGDSEDLIQEGMIGLISAIRQYDPGRDVPFRTFAELCIRNRMLTAVRSALRMKHNPLNNYVSFESPQFDENDTAITKDLRNPEELVISGERVEEIMHSLTATLSPFEEKVLGQFLKGSSYAQIASETGKTEKSVDNAVQRIRKKLSKHLYSGDISVN